MNRYERRSDDAIRDLAIRVYRGEVFTSLSVRRIEDVKFVFLPFALADTKMIGWMKVQKISMFYASMSDALPRTMNGYPIFATMNVLNDLDTKRFRNAYMKVQQAVDGTPTRTKKPKTKTKQTPNKKVVVSCTTTKKKKRKGK